MATLNDFTNKTGSNNLVVELPKEEREKIIFGADCVYTFVVDIVQNLKTIFAIFNQGGLVYKTKTNALGGEVTTTISEGKMTIVVPLSNTETSELGRNPLLTNSLQVKYELNDGTMIYDKYIVLENINTLDN